MGLYLDLEARHQACANLICVDFRRQSGESLELPKLETIPQVPGNRAKVAQNHDARKAVSASLLVLK